MIQNPHHPVSILLSIGAATTPLAAFFSAINPILTGVAAICSILWFVYLYMHRNPK